MHPDESAAATRLPMPADELRRLRAIGMLSGPLVGIGVTMLLASLLAILIAFILRDLMYMYRSPIEEPTTWWVLAQLVTGAVLAGAGLFNSRRRLRHWEHRRAVRVTRAGSALSVLGALLVFFAVSGAGVVFDSTGAQPFVGILVWVAALLGLVLIGRLVWPWMGRVVRG